MAEGSPGVVAVHEPEAAGDRPEAGRRLGQPFGVVDGEGQTGPGEALLRTGDHRLGEVDAHGASGREPVGQRRSRDPRPARDVETVPVGQGGEQVQPPGGQVPHPFGEHLLVGQSDATPGVAQPGLLGRFHPNRVVDNRLTRHVAPA